jgi:hypothetical protein
VVYLEGVPDSASKAPEVFWSIPEFLEGTPEWCAGVQDAREGHTE